MPLMKLIALMVMLAAGASAADLFVAPNGRDDNPGTRSQPFKTLVAARDAARKLPGNKTIFVRGGSYELAHALTLNANDSGVTWRALANEQPVIIGGHALANFTSYQGRILKTPGIKGVYFRQLFFDGQRQHLARYPNFDEKDPCGGGWAYAAGKPVPMYQNIPGENKHTLWFKAGDARHWAHPRRGGVCIPAFQLVE